VTLQERIDEMTALQRLLYGVGVGEVLVNVDGTAHVEELHPETLEWDATARCWVVRRAA
jgi:hypothetical protein